MCQNKSTMKVIGNEISQNIQKHLEIRIMEESKLKN